MFAEIPFAGDPKDDAALLALVAANPSCRLELSSDGKILVSPLTGTATAPKEAAAFLQLNAWARVAGGRAYIASAGFRLPDESVLGPDAAWISAETLAALSPEDKGTAFWRVCPEVVIEIMSAYDSWPGVMRKIRRYMRNGVGYAVGVDYEARSIYALGVAPQGLVLDFEAIFDA